MTSALDHIALAHRWVQIFVANDEAAMRSVFARDASHETWPRVEPAAPVIGADAVAAWWKQEREGLPPGLYFESVVTANAQRVVVELHAVERSAGRDHAWVVVFDPVGPQSEHVRSSRAYRC